MSKHPRTKKQVRADKAALKKLQSTGLLRSKPDLRRAPTKHQRSLIRKFSDVLKGSAAVVRPKSPSSYAGKFRVIGDKVIVPKGKGEKITISKTGKIKRTRKVGKRHIPSTITALKPESGAPRPMKYMAIVYRVPFRRGTQKFGERIDWRRFSYDGLLKFFSEYLRSMEQFDEWAGFIEIEELPIEYERELDRYISGEVTHDPPQYAPPKIAKKAKRRLRKGVKDEIGSEE